jgi:hypothetical protein
MIESNNPIQPLTKIVVARAQLVTALDLFARDKDPISIQCLACGGGEIIEALAEAHGEEPFAMHILETQPDMDRKAIRRLRNQYWNAFKHFSDRKGFAREDEDLLSRFDDTKNETALEAPAGFGAGFSGLVVRAQRRKAFPRHRFRRDEDRVPGYQAAAARRAKAAAATDD